MRVRRQWAVCLEGERARDGVYRVVLLCGILLVEYSVYYVLYVYALLCLGRCLWPLCEDGCVMPT